MISVTLGDWRLHVEGDETVPATAPGSVHGALIAAGKIADPYLDLNELRQDWVSRRDWVLSCDFRWSSQPGTTTELVFDGIDTFAEITLNGVVLGKTQNMHRSYRFDIGAHLRDDNRLEVRLRSAWTVGDEIAQRIAPRPSNYPGPANLMRKMACSFGWDWGPTLVSAGLWRPVRIESAQHARLRSVRPTIGLDGANGTASAIVEVARQPDQSAGTVRMTVAGVTTEAPLGPTDERVDVSVVVPSPAIWWPHNLGHPALHDLTIELCDSTGAVLDTWTRRVGFRSTRLVTEPDEHGTSFVLVVNDVPIYVFGANWIPDDTLLERVTTERYRERVAQAKAASINLLRVWGGGVYETREFYEICDEAGVLVWQDFLFACAAYPEEEELATEVEAEARENVARLMPHPSLVLWNGNNENIWLWADVGWQDVLGNKSWGLGYYLELLPRIVGEVDPSRPYWPGSPYSGTMDIRPNDPAHGCMHIWDVWNEAGYEVYRNYVPRLCAEFGWQAPPTYATMMESISERPLTMESAAIAHHQKATNGNLKLLNGLAGHLPVPTTVDDWLFVTQLNQARAIRFGIEHMRSHRGVNMGAIVWQLNDCWPVVSWSAIDGAGRLKPLWYALRHAYSDHLLTIQSRDGGLTLFAVNDRSLFWRCPVKVKRVRLDGTVLAEWSHWRLNVDRLDIESLVLPADIVTPDNPQEELIVARMLDAETHWFFREDIDLALPRADYTVDVTNDGSDQVVTITAKTFLRDLCIFADRLHPDASIDHMMVNLFPGESRKFRLTAPTRFTVDDLRSPGVIRTVNDLLGP